MGDGGDPCPFMFAGGDSALRQGRSLSYAGVDYRNVLDTAAAAVGIDIEGADYPKYGNGVLAEILA